MTKVGMMTKQKTGVLLHVPFRTRNSQHLRGQEPPVLTDVQHACQHLPTQPDTKCHRKHPAGMAHSSFNMLGAMPFFTPDQHAGGFLKYIYVVVQ